MATRAPLERLGETESFAAFVLSMFPRDVSASLSPAFAGGWLCIARHRGVEYRETRDTAAAAATAVLELLTKATPRDVLARVREMTPDAAPIDDDVQLPLPLTDA